MSIVAEGWTMRAMDVAFLGSNFGSPFERAL
jgi:hypothetical protein